MRHEADVEMVRSFLLGSHAEDGAKLPTERALAEQLGISRNVVRRALTVLEVEGRVQRKVGSGTYFVKSAREKAADSMGATEMRSELLNVNPRQIIEARLSFEPNMAGIAAMNCTTLDLELLAECARECHRADTFASYEVADQNFHVAIAAATHNPVLICADRCFRAASAAAEWGGIRKRFLTAQRRVASRIEHDKILTAIRSRDAAMAVAAAREHLQHAATALLQQ